MKNEMSSFKENIRHAFLAYSLFPAFMVTCLLLVLLSFGWSFGIAYYNKQEHISSQKMLTTLLEKHLYAFQSIETIYAHSDKKFEPEIKSRICAALYQADQSGDCQGNIIFLSKQGDEAFYPGDKNMYFLTQPEYQNWGIMYQMKKAAGSICVHCQNGYICMGKAAADQAGNIQGYQIISLPLSNVGAAIHKGSRQMLLTDREGWVVYGSVPNLQDDLGRLLPELKGKNGFLYHEGHYYYISSSLISDGQLLIYTFVDTGISTLLIGSVFALILLLFIGLFIFTFYSTEKMSIKYTRDIEILAKAFGKVAAGDLEQKVSFKSSQEFASIGKDFNLMISGLKKQIIQNKELAEHVAFAQVKQLESQFNPHFLFNTLDNIRYIAKVDAKTADKMIVALSKLLRYSIRDPREEITIDEDLSNLESYLTILKLRFNKRFFYTIEIEDAVRNCLIPKLLMQPVLENAVKYGFQEKESLHVVIKGYRKGDQLIFFCQDDGSGMDSGLLNELTKQLAQEKCTGTHTGLFNIHRRIRLLYKENYGVRIESSVGEGTTVMLVLPLHWE